MSLIPRTSSLAKKVHDIFRGYSNSKYFRVVNESTEDIFVFIRDPVGQTIAVCGIAGGAGYSSNYYVREEYFSVEICVDGGAVSVVEHICLLSKHRGLRFKGRDFSPSENDLTLLFATRLASTTFACARLVEPVVEQAVVVTASPVIQHNAPPEQQPPLQQRF